MSGPLPDPGSAAVSGEGGEPTEPDGAGQPLDWLVAFIAVLCLLGVVACCCALSGLRRRAAARESEPQRERLTAGAVRDMESRLTKMYETQLWTLSGRMGERERADAAAAARDYRMRVEDRLAGKLRRSGV